MGAVYPAPALSIVTPVTAPEAATVAVAIAPSPVPSLMNSTVGADVYPPPGSVRVNSVTAPSAPTVAVACAPEPPPPVNATATSGVVSGLFAQFGQGPK